MLLQPFRNRYPRLFLEYFVAQRRNISIRYSCAGKKGRIPLNGSGKAAYHGKRGGEGVKMWVADAQMGLMLVTENGCRKIGPPGCALCAGKGKIYCAGTGRCGCYDWKTGEMCFDFPLPGGVCALGMAGDKICALSSDADSISAFDGERGELLFSAPAGVYPRDFSVSPCGRYLAVAGGAAGEILLFDEMLQCRMRHRVAGIACGVAFLPRCLAALCAVGEGELSARLLLISPRGVMEEAFLCPDVPCALCALPGGQCLIGCHGAVYGLRADGKIMPRLACAYPARIRLAHGQGLICDAWQGDVLRLNGRCLYRGKEPADALLL